MRNKVAYVGDTGGSIRVNYGKRDSWLSMKGSNGQESLQMSLKLVWQWIPGKVFSKLPLYDCLLSRSGDNMLAELDS